MNEQTVLFNILGKQVGEIILNRPQALNAITREMIIAISQQLTEWRQRDDIKAVIIRSNSERAFCAGGDIRQLYQLGQQSPQQGATFLWHEYRMNHQIYHFNKPYIALLNGITFGGGAGLSFHGSHKVVTENFLFAMPETAIGFFPDIGAGHFFKQCPDHVGMYLGLTGTRISSGDAIALGLVDHVINSASLKDLIDSIAHHDYSNNINNEITDIINSHSNANNQATITQHYDDIQRCFSQPSVETIIAALTQLNNDFAKQALLSLNAASPTSLKVTQHSLAKSTALSLDDTLKRDYRLAYHFLHDNDFFEGVRAQVIDKDKSPQWQPKQLSEISEPEVMRYFDSLGDEDLQFITH